MNGMNTARLFPLKWKHTERFLAIVILSSVAQSLLAAVSVA